MKAAIYLRAGGLLGAGLLLAACDGGVVVDFAAPFPAARADMPAFPARHQAVYTAADSTTSLCVGPRAVWQQELRHEMRSRRQLDSLPHRLSADSTYQESSGRRHYLRLVGADSVRDSWLECDTVFTLLGTNPGRLRRFQGQYYLSSPDETGNWWVQRLEIAGPQLVWQTLGQDTLRLRALDAATVQRRREKNYTAFHLTPAPGPQMRRVGRYAGLWTTAGEFVRRR